MLLLVLFSKRQHRRDYCHGRAGTCEHDLDEHAPVHDSPPDREAKTLVAVGEDDLLTPPHLAEEMAAAIPGAHLVRFAGSGHLPSMEVPEAVNAAMRDWLAD